MKERLPEEWARRLADRLEELERTNSGALIKLSVYVSNGRITDLRWDSDERIPLTAPRPKP